jgi:hypothetical protein
VAKIYRVEQVARASMELRQAAGAEEQRFSAEDVVEMLGEEIRLLRERGFSDERIAELLGGFEIGVTAEEIGKWAKDGLEGAE